MAAIGGPPWRHGVDIDWTPVPPRAAVSGRSFDGDENDLMGFLATNPIAGPNLRHLDQVKGWLEYVESSSPEGLRFIAGELEVLAGALRTTASNWDDEQ